MTAGIPNGETHAQAYPPAEYIGRRGQTRGTETSQYPEEKKSTEIPRVVVSEMGAARPRKAFDTESEAGWKAPPQQVTGL